MANVRLAEEQSNQPITTVFVVCHEWDYENWDIIAAFIDEQEAIKFADALDRSGKYDGTFPVREVDLIYGSFVGHELNYSPN